MRKIVAPVSNCRGIGKKDMRLNDYLPKIEVLNGQYEIPAVEQAK